MQPARYNFKLLTFYSHKIGWSNSMCLRLYSYLHDKIIHLNLTLSNKLFALKLRPSCLPLIAGNLLVFATNCTLLNFANFANSNQKSRALQFIWLRGRQIVCTRFKHQPWWACHSTLRAQYVPTPAISSEPNYSSKLFLIRTNNSVTPKNWFLQFNRSL